MKPFSVVLLSLLAVTLLALSIPATSHAAPAGRYFDSLVIIAMENRNYNDVMGDGHGSSSAPFIASLLPNSATVPNYHGGYPGSSEASYVALISGDTYGSSNGVRDIGTTSTVTIVNRFETSGVSWHAYCEESCGRSGDHFPWIDFVSIVSSSSRMANVDAGGVSTSNLVSAIGSKNFLWFTPEDSHNMHDNSVDSGDSYLASFVPAILSQPPFTTGRGVLMLWWDEYDPAPFLMIGPPVVRGLISGRNDVEHYTILKMIEDNWNMAPITGNDGGASSMADFFGQGPPPPPPGQLTASFSYTPSSPVDGDTVTFTGAASGGTPGYSFTWDLAGTTATGATASKAFTAGTYVITLTVHDTVGQTGTAQQTLTVTTGTPTCTSGTCRPSTWPYLIGWGGSFLDDAFLKTGNTGQASQVFPGEAAPNMELLVIRMKAWGYNVIRVSWDPTCTPQDSGGLSNYSPVNLQRAIDIAAHFGFWIVADYHGYNEMTTDALRTCWLSFWSPVTQQFRNSYTQLIWEPLNEPISVDIPRLSQSYQLWIDQTRAQGDTHWIVVQNLCSNTCPFSDYSQGYPAVDDGNTAKIFISLHSYMGYPYITPWDTAQAEAYANQFYSALLTGELQTGWPSLNTEGGTDPLVVTCGGSAPTGCPPDTVLSGSAGYGTVTYHFIATLTQLYNTHNPRINWIWWPVGSWTDTPGAGTFGALADNGWGTILSGQIPPPPPPPSGCTTNCGGYQVNVFFQYLPIIAAAGLAVTGLVLLAMPGRKGR